LRSSRAPATNFPFSHYAYTQTTRGDELFLSNIPAFVPAGYARHESPRGVALAGGVIAFDVLVAFSIGAVGFAFAALGGAGIIGVGLWLVRRRNPVVTERPPS